MADPKPPTLLPTISLPTKQRSLPTVPLGKVSWERVDAWLRAHANPYPPVCSICQNQLWRIGEDIVQFPFWHAPNTPRPYAYPIVIMACARCGNHLALSAVQMGAVEPANG